MPALDDLCYTVTPGDTLAGIAAQHDVAVDVMHHGPVEWLRRAALPCPAAPGRRCCCRVSRLKPSLGPTIAISSLGFLGDLTYKDWPYGDGKFIWPVTGWISQGAHPGHTALDVAVPSGTPVKAVDHGKVIMAGWNPTGYGFRVVIDHGIDYVTLYAHLSDIYVKAGDVVGKGQVIGASGANGNITGPHLHFEIRDFGRLTDPLPLLPK